MFGFKKKNIPSSPKPLVAYTYKQSATNDGFRRIKLSSHGYQPAMDGILALAGADLTNADITVNIFGGDSPRGVVVVDGHEVGTIWETSFDKFKQLTEGGIDSIRIEIRGNESYLFYKV